MMKKIYDLEKYREEKEKSENDFSESDNGIREMPEEEFEDFLEYDMRLDFDNYKIYNDKFIEENAEHIVNYTIPHCVICKNRLSEGDKVDTMWPMDYGFNICKKCENKLPNKMKNKKITNLSDLEIILVEDDYEKIIDTLRKKDIKNINGIKITTEEKYQEVRYQVLEMKDDLRL